MSIMPAPRRNRIILGAIVAVLVFLLPMLGKSVGLLTDFWWFREIGLKTIFVRILEAKLGCGLITGLIAFVIIYLNIIIADRIAARSGGFVSILNVAYSELGRLVPALKYLLPAVALVLAFLVGSWGGGAWETFLKFRGAVPFGSTDPLFEKDIGFYVFALPFYRVLYQGIVTVLSLSFVVTGALYVVRQCLGYDGKRVVFVKQARAHLMILLGLIAASLYWFFQLKIYGMVQGTGSIVNGAGFADIKVYIPALRIMGIAGLAAGLLLFVNIWSRNWRPAILAGAILALGMIVAKSAVSTVQKFVVAPNEMAKEAPYIDWSIRYTRAAYKVDSLEERSFTPAENLSADMLERNRATTNNIRLWDQAPLLTTYGQLQEIRTYYNFLDVDNDRYKIDGQLRQVMFSPRELIPSALPSRIWINEHLSFTHGYGLCLGPVNSVTAEGLPDFFIKNIPPASSTNIHVTRPDIYYGESPATYAIVKTGNKEFDYPSGDDNVYTTYGGTGGIPMGGMLKRAVFAMRFGELKILLTGYIHPDSRILFYRNIMDRAKMAFPFISFDPDPYMVIANDGRLYWIVDGYTTSDAYPYSAQFGGMGNYIRNSVKVTIDAYNGTVVAYTADASDPVIRTYAKVFPGVFRPLSEMPADLHAHIRYPQTLFSVQAKIYAIYHMTDPQVFYNKEDIWKIPESFTEGQSGPMAPYYTIMKLAGVGEGEEFILMVPFSPSKKENMIAWFAARCDEPNYGKLLVFDFPKEKLVYGPSQIESRINQDPEISKVLTLWNQGGSRVIFGSLLVIPIEQSLIYVQPLYLAAQSGGVPELKRVIVAYGNNIAMEETLEKSLNIIFGKSTLSAVTGAQPPEMLTSGKSLTPAAADLIAEANRQFVRAQSELAKGNWGGYGSAMADVERALKELSRISGQSTK